jgi:hypothetical protein
MNYRTTARVSAQVRSGTVGTGWALLALLAVLAAAVPSCNLFNDLGNAWCNAEDDGAGGDDGAAPLRPIIPPSRRRLPRPTSAGCIELLSSKPCEPARSPGDGDQVYGDPSLCAPTTPPFPFETQQRSSSG